MLHTNNKANHTISSHALSSAARHVNKADLTVELGPWEGTQFSAPAVKDGDSLRFAFAEF